MKCQSTCAGFHISLSLSEQVSGDLYSTSSRDDSQGQIDSHALPFLNNNNCYTTSVCICFAISMIYLGDF